MVFALFDLANQPSVQYRCSSGVVLDIKQNNRVEDCNGGIVWETAFVLSSFVEQHRICSTGTLVLEVGAGCGLVGLVCAAAGAQVVLRSEVNNFE